MSCKLNIIILTFVIFHQLLAVGQNLNISYIDSLKSKLNPKIKSRDDLIVLEKITSYYKRQSIDSALKWGEKFLKYSIDYGNNFEIAEAYNKIGQLQLNDGSFSKSLKSYMEALAYYKKANDLGGMARQYHNVGYIMTILKDSTEALKYYQHEFDVLNTIHDTSGIANAYNQKAMFYGGYHLCEQAKFYHFKALELYILLRDSLSIGLCFHGIANDFNCSKQFDSAAVYHRLALEWCKNDTFSISMIYLGMGEYFHLPQSDYKGAIESFNKAISLAKNTNHLDWAADGYQQIGSLYLKNAKSKKILRENKISTNEALQIAESNLIKALYLRLVNGSRGYLISIYSTLIEIKEQQGNLREALIYSKRLEEQREESKDSKHLIQITREMVSADFRTRELLAQKDISHQKLIRNSILGGTCILGLSALFSFIFYKRKRDAEQKQRDAEQKQKQDSLNLQISETEMKALRSQMNPHFIFNALQSIQTFVLSHQSEEANIYLLKFSKLMRAVLENSQHSEVPIEKDVEVLKLYMDLESIRLSHPFTYQFHIDKSINIENDTIPPLILQPFVENSIWHGLQYKPESGHINIYLAKKDNALYATVEDNGIGRNISTREEQTVMHKKESLGMKLTEERLKILNEIKKIEAQFEITDLYDAQKKPKGTKVELSLPLAS